MDVAVLCRTGPKNVNILLCNETTIVFILDVYRSRWAGGLAAVQERRQVLLGRRSSHLYRPYTLYAGQFYTGYYLIFQMSTYL